jgi:hypothetical protein
MGGPTFNATVSGNGEPGVRGTSTGGFGVTGVSNSSLGVYGESIAGVGVAGYSFTDTGVVGQQGGTAPGAPHSAGVAGTSGDGYGVAGYSDIHTGVYGECITGRDVGGIGVHGVAPHVSLLDIGVKGEGLTGVQGEGQTGVFGVGSTGPGVAGASNGSPGVSGSSSGDNGVRGDFIGPFGSGVLGSGVLGVNMSREGFGVYGLSNAAHPLNLPTVGGRWGAAVFGQNTVNGLAGYFQGDVTVIGTLSKSGGGFMVDHPLDPANRCLSHSFVESPDMMNVYNGNVSTDDEGNAMVELPGYFEALNRDFRYQLTPIGEFAQAIVAEEVRDNRFRIKTDRPSVRVSWQITGIRQDAWAKAHRIEVDVEKPEDQRGRYLAPAEHDQPPTAGIFHMEEPSASEEIETDQD